MGYKLKGFLEHGVQLSAPPRDDQIQGICPFCRKPKFYAHSVAGLWDCKSCGVSGNFEGFLARRMKTYTMQLTPQARTTLAQDRKLPEQAITAWGVGYSRESQEYMIPVNCNADRKLVNVLRYKLGGKCMSTAGATLALLASKDLHGSTEAWICEGVWDSMALWDCLRAKGKQEDVYASPGAGAFPRGAAPLFFDKAVRVCFDFDEPGCSGARRTGSILEGTTKETKYLSWPNDGTLKPGYDVRDLYIQTGTDALVYITERLVLDMPASTALQAAAATAAAADGNGRHALLTTANVLAPVAAADAIPAGPPITREEVIERYRKWLHLQDTEMLDVMYGAAFANRIKGDPLWVFLVAPPGGSKSELLMSLGDAPRMAAATSMTPHTLISGSSAGGGDPSLIPKLNGKTLIIKDFTAILTMNVVARDEIFGILRDAYDGKIEKHYGNGVTRKYVSKFGIIAGVTPAVESMSAGCSVLGERFIRYFIRCSGTIHVGKEAIQRAISNISIETSMREDLRKIGVAVLSRDISGEEQPKITERVSLTLQHLAQFVSALRGAVTKDRYTKTILHKPVQEIGTRLAKQLGMLAIGISMYKQEKEIGQETMNTITQVAKDTVPDRVEEIVRQMYIHATLVDGEFGGVATPTEVGTWTRFPSGTVSEMLPDLELLHVVRRVAKSDSKQIGDRWRLRPAIMQLIGNTNMYHKELRHAAAIHKARR